MSLFQQAADLNNQGITALLNGDRKSAIQSMTDSIKFMKAQLTQSQTDCHNSAVVTSAQTTHTVEIQSMESSDTIVFNQAIRIPADVSLTVSEFEVDIYSCAVIFNLALVHHFEASSGADADAYLMKAEKLYSMALQLLDKTSLTVHTALIVKLACINNLSQIRYAKGDYKNAREGLSQVSAFIRQPSNQAVLEEPEIQGLLMNVLLLKAPRVAAAA